MTTANYSNVVTTGKAVKFVSVEDAMFFFELSRLDAESTWEVIDSNRDFIKIALYGYTENRKKVFINGLQVMRKDVEVI